MDPILSVIIPTRARPEKLRACLDLLSAQSPSTPPFEVLVALDGPCAASASVCQEPRPPLELLAFEAPRQGIAVAKNAAIERARGRLLLFINDDILPDPGFIAAHAAAHDELDRTGRAPAMILGHSPWVLPPDATLFDRLLAHSSMVFFYDRMITEGGTPLDDRERDWGFRHAWNLNLSLPATLAREAGGFCPAIANCCYEDIEFAWRVRQTADRPVPVLFRPEALAPHDHRYTPSGYLDREFRLGYSAYGFAKASPQCAREVFGIEIDGVDELAYAARFIAHEERAEPRLREAFESLTTLPANAAGQGDHASKMLRLLEQQQLLLKRLIFRKGLIHAAEGGTIEGLFHPADALDTALPFKAHARA
ncbi:MAG: glycosyltransferase family 2 protein [Phycisphaerales bacterium JB065]